EGVVYSLVGAFGYKIRGQAESARKIIASKEGEVVQKYLDGKFVKDLAVEYSVSNKAITNLLNRLKVQLRPKGLEIWRVRRSKLEKC
ncbi:MAG: hypothetical protein WBE18_03795, partial [Gammaproteobacteria bacterium]